MQYKNQMNAKIILTSSYPAFIILTGVLLCKHYKIINDRFPSARSHDTPLSRAHIKFISDFFLNMRILNEWISTKIKNLFSHQKFHIHILLLPPRGNKFITVER